MYSQELKMINNYNFNYANVKWANILMALQHRYNQTSNSRAKQLNRLDEAILISSDILK